MSDKKIEELKKKFIISPEEYDKSLLSEQIEIVLKFCRVDPNGRVLVDKLNLTNKEKVKLVLVARFLASKLDSNISAEVGVDDISENVNISPHQARARISEIVREGFATTKERGSYLVTPYKIDAWLFNLIKSRNLDNS
ncbi:MAG: hypothetical protein ACE5KE_09655 [Methanosarcinales archaeon]